MKIEQSANDIEQLLDTAERSLEIARGVVGAMRQHDVPTLLLQTGKMKNHLLPGLWRWAQRLRHDAESQLFDATNIRAQRQQFDTEQAVLARHREEQSQTKKHKKGK
jgi:hypothetical protein